MIESAAKIFKEGGPFMWVILSVMAIAVAIVLDRLFFYFVTCRTNGVQLVGQVMQKLDKGNVDEARTLLSKGTSPLHVLALVAFDQHKQGATTDDIEESIAHAAITEMPRMNQRLNYLSMFANIATLLGLLGTIFGLQSSFASLGAVEASKKASMLAAGIAEAMNCTGFGLVVAVPCMVAYTFLYNKQQILTRDLDEAIVRLVSYFKKKKA